MKKCWYNGKWFTVLIKIIYSITTSHHHRSTGEKKEKKMLPSEIFSTIHRRDTLHRRKRITYSHTLYANCSYNTPFKCVGKQRDRPLYHQMWEAITSSILFVFFLFFRCVWTENRLCIMHIYWKTMNQIPFIDVYAVVSTRQSRSSTEIEDAYSYSYISVPIHTMKVKLISFFLYLLLYIRFSIHKKWWMLCIYEW